MPLEIDYLPVAVGGSALVDPQSNFVGSGYQVNGFQVGVAVPAQVNKVWRQSSMVAAAIATFISNQLSINVLDDGNLANLITNLTNAINAAASGAAYDLVPVAFSATPTFTATAAAIVVFEITLTGNVTSSTLTDIQPGQTLIFIVKQDATGGRTFVPPTNAPISTIAGGANATNVQHFIVDSGSHVYAVGPMIVN